MKSYPTGFWRRRVRVLDDVSFTVGENEVVGFAIWLSFSVDSFPGCNSTPRAPPP